MRKPRAKQARSEARRQQILEAALACFSDMGPSDTTMSDICRCSKASNGSVYHHFKSKDELAAAVYLEGLIRYQTGFLTELERYDEARGGIRAMVRYHLRWVIDHPDWARFLFQMRRADFMTAKEPELVKHNSHFLSKTSNWFKPHVESGCIRKLPRELYFFLLLGPVHDFARHWLAGRTRTEIDVAGEELANAAWLSLKGDAAG